MDPADPPPLRLQPLDDADRSQVERLLQTPRLRRRVLFSGLHQLHPIDWSPQRRTFVIREGDEVVGTVELRQEEDEPETWELSVVIEQRERMLDGARCALAGLFFAFEVMDAEAVWFWAPRENRPVRRVAEKLGFVKLHPLLVPGGKPADVFELERRTWQTHTIPHLAAYLGAPIEITDNTTLWRGESQGFFAVEPGGRPG